MQKLIFSALSLLLVIILLESFAPLEILKKDGAAPGYTGSPGDSLKNCTACHGGNAESVPDWVTSNIPIEGYTPGKTYTITATNNEGGATRFGFEVSPQNAKGDLLGTMVVTDAIKTKLVGTNKYITYTENGVESTNFMAWSFDWVAPPSGTGDVTFYGAFNSNFDGHKSGDKTFLSTLQVSEKGTSGLKNSTANPTNFKIYPNSTSDIVNISLNIKGKANIKVDIIDLTGKQVATIINGGNDGMVLKQFSTAGLLSGNYLVRLLVDGKAATEKLTVNH